MSAPPPLLSALDRTPLRALLVEDSAADAGLMVMAGRNGPDLAGRFAARRPRRRVLHMSGYIDDDILRCGVLEGSAHFIRKPYSSGELSRKVWEVLGAPGENPSPPTSSTKTEVGSR